MIAFEITGTEAWLPVVVFLLVLVLVMWILGWDGSEQ